MPSVPKPSHKRRVPKRFNRGKFGKIVRQQIIDRDQGLCRQCGRPASQIHHVKIKSQGGRGVMTNGLLVCDYCHKQIHADYNLLKYWQIEFYNTYGDGFWKDCWD